jgi:Zn-dependent peptidase ImmA (M78 family)
MRLRPDGERRSDQKVVALTSLLTEARRLGVRVHLAHLQEPFLGLYDDGASRIFVSLGLPMDEVKATLAHELGHALYRHDCSTPANERQADRRGAWLLVNPQEYAAAEAISDHPAAIADELGITEKVIEDYRTYWLSEARTFES